MFCWRKNNMEGDLQVLHIIPSAFNYFDDVKSYAFGVLNEMNAYDDVSATALTLQYGTPTIAEKQAVSAVAPDQEYKGAHPVEEVAKNFSDFDIVHLHAPFLGAAGHILQWKKEFPKIPLVITLYRPVVVVDLIAWGIKWYNNYYLPKLFEVADLVTVFPWSEKMANKITERNKIDVSAKVRLLFESDSFSQVQIIEKRFKQEEIVKNLFYLYSNLV